MLVHRDGDTREETLDRRTSYTYQLAALVDALDHGASCRTSKPAAACPERVGVRGR